MDAKTTPQGVTIARDFTVRSTSQRTSNTDWVSFAGYRPNQVVAVGDPATSVVPLLAGRFAIDGRPTAFVCRNFACDLPTTDVETMMSSVLAPPKPAEKR